MRLGSGGMGDVYRARDRLLERPVAVKVPTTTITPASAERFKREARAAARLNHPNVVGVYDWAAAPSPSSSWSSSRARASAPSSRPGARSRRPRSPPSGRRSPTPRARTPPRRGAPRRQAEQCAAHAGRQREGHRLRHRLLGCGSRRSPSRGSCSARSATSRRSRWRGCRRRAQRLVFPRHRPHRAAHRRATDRRRSRTRHRPRTDRGRARAADPSARHQVAADLRDGSGRLRRPARGPPALAPPARTGAPIAAVSVTVATDADADSNATARATVPARTSVLPVAGPRPPRRPSPRLRARRSGTEAATVPARQDRVPQAGQGAEAGQAVEAAEAEAAGSQQQLGPPSPSPMVALAGAGEATRTWKARHWAVILAAPLLVITGGAIAYAKLTEHAPIVAVPDVEGPTSSSPPPTLHEAGFEVDGNKVTSPRPGGTILAQRPANGEKLEQGSTVHLTVSRHACRRARGYGDELRGGEGGAREVGADQRAGARARLPRRRGTGHGDQLEPGGVHQRDEDRADRARRRRRSARRRAQRGRARPGERHRAAPGPGSRGRGAEREQPEPGARSGAEGQPRERRNPRAR